MKSRIIAPLDKEIEKLVLKKVEEIELPHLQKARSEGMYFGICFMIWEFLENPHLYKKTKIGDLFSKAFSDLEWLQKEFGDVAIDKIIHDIKREGFDVPWPEEVIK